MIIIRDSSLLPATCAGSVMALGNFDGLHIGHREVIGQAVALAQANGKLAAVMTFEPHPRHIFRPDLPTLKILTFAQKARLLQEMGIAMLRVVRFTPAFSHTPAKAFVTDLLGKALHVSHVVTGDDFVFGHNREGGAALLAQMAQELGFGFTACKPVLVDGERCSSTRLRAFLAAADMPQAARLLGRPYSIAGRVREGDKRGRTLGFPTANIVPSGIFLPAAGVYAVQASVQGRTLSGVANLGTRPTFGGTRMQLEVHLFDWQGDLYGKRIEVMLLKRIREERKFDGIEALKKQIVEDSAKAKMLLSKR